MSLGKLIREKREQLNLTLDEVSRRTGYSKPYLSTIETGRVKNPPADELLIKLEKLLDFDTGLLLYVAHLEKLPADVRGVLESSRAENERWRTLIRHLAQKGGSLEDVLQGADYREILDNTLSNYEHVSTAGKLVPVINNVAAGYPVDYDDMDYPPGAADDYVRCCDLHDPNAFAVRVVGDSMEPKYYQGDIIVFSPQKQVNNGDDCFVRMTDPHETTFKQVFFEQNNNVRLQPRNHKYPPLVLPPERINGIYRAVIRYENLS